MNYKKGKIEDVTEGVMYFRAPSMRVSVVGIGATKEEAYKKAIKNAQEDVLELQKIIEEAECES